MGNAPARDGCSFSSGVSTEAIAAIYYDGADTDSLPTTTTSLTTEQKNRCFNDISIPSALCPVEISDDFDTLTLSIAFQSNGTNNLWLMNQQTFRANLNVNLLENVIEGNTTFDKDWAVVAPNPRKKAVRIHLINTFFAFHPFVCYSFLCPYHPVTNPSTASPRTRLQRPC